MSEQVLLQNEVQIVKVKRVGGVEQDILAVRESARVRRRKDVVGYIPKFQDTQCLG